MGNCQNCGTRRQQRPDGVQWERDSTVSNCRLCGKKFAFLKRKHHCRTCGKIFCSTCCTKRGRGQVKMCTPCTTEQAARCRQTSNNNSRTTTTTTTTTTQARFHRVTTTRVEIVVCPHCNETVSAEISDGHIEMCRLNQRKQEREAGPKNEPVSCGYCGEMLHPMLIAGHVEVCKRGNEQNEGRGKTGSEDIDEEELCVICFEFRKNIAFEPCGHWACCSGCTIKINTCPICRRDIHGRIDVEKSNVNISMCPVCENHVHPTFFNGHREVCRLHQKRVEEEVAREKKEKAEQDKGSEEEETKEPNTTPTKHKFCNLCNTAPRQVASVPCGHYTMCLACSNSATSCPICYVTITSNLPLYT